MFNGTTQVTFTDTKASGGGLSAPLVDAFRKNGIYVEGAISVPAA